MSLYLTHECHIYHFFIVILSHSIIHKILDRIFVFLFQTMALKRQRSLQNKQDDQDFFGNLMIGQSGPAPIPYIRNMRPRESETI